NVDILPPTSPTVALSPILDVAADVSLLSSAPIDTSHDAGILTALTNVAAILPAPIDAGALFAGTASVAAPTAPAPAPVTHDSGLDHIIHHLL
ncbi:MAG TPA: hypothetical protein VFR09_04760, partial [Alphaproteobacteria bacterium]|nr:hypothetical protein [Alphaproteobacteria bacterium]